MAIIDDIKTCAMISKKRISEVQRKKNNANITTDISGVNNKCNLLMCYLSAFCKINSCSCVNIAHTLHIVHSFVFYFVRCFCFFWLVTKLRMKLLSDHINMGITIICLSATDVRVKNKCNGEQY